MYTHARIVVQIPRNFYSSVIDSAIYTVYYICMFSSYQITYLF